MLAIGRNLIARGHRVSVFTTNADDLEAFWVPGHRTYATGEASVEGITVHRFAISYDVIRRRATRLAGLVPYWRWKAQYWRPAFHVPGLREQLRQVNADILHVGPLPYNNLMYEGIQAAEARSAPVIATPCVHFGEPGSSEVAKHYVQPHQLELLRRCDRVLCMTPGEAQELASRGIANEKLAVIGHGIDMERVVGGDGERLRRKHNIDGLVVLQLGMKAADKGSIALVEAMKVLWAESSQAWLVMAGPSLRAFDEYLATQTQRFPRLVNLPVFSDDEKRDLLAAADLVAQPSRVESLGLVLMEAWANGKPVIAADISVSRQLISDSGGGIVVPFGDAKRLASAIASLLADAGKRQAMGVSGQKTANNFDGRVLWPRNAEQFEDLVGERVESRSH